MPNTKIFFLTFILIFSSITGANCAIFDYGFEENQDYIEIDYVENIYAPRRLRKILDYYANLDLSKKANRKEVAKINNISEIKPTEEYLKLFKEKFIVTQIKKIKYKDECGDGSDSFTITIYPAAMESLSITINDDGKICKIKDHDIKYRRDREEYLIKDYADYWL